MSTSFVRCYSIKNGYVLEQLCSPLIVCTSPEHAELRALAAGCVTRFHARHYLRFAETQWNLFSREHPRRVKPLLYVYRVLLTGLHLLRTGVVEANLVTLNAEARLSHVSDLIARKQGGAEQAALDNADVNFHAREYQRLVRELEEEFQRSTLPAAPPARDAVSDLLVRIRLKPANEWAPICQANERKQGPRGGPNSGRHPQDASCHRAVRRSDSGL